MREIARKVLVYSLIIVLSMAMVAGLMALMGVRMLGVILLDSPMRLILASLIASAFFIAIRGVTAKFMNARNPLKRGALRQKLMELSKKIEEHTDPSGFAECVLRGVQDLFDVENVQLTLYYDLPFSLEVTNVRLAGDEFDTRVEQVCEDETPQMVGSEDLLNSFEAEFSELLTYRERLVGLLEIGGKTGKNAFKRVEREILAELVQMIASAADQVMMIRDLSQAHQRLFESEKLISIGQLASGIAHEIRNPLSSVKMNLQGLARAEQLGERSRRRVQISLEEIERLDSIIGELMQFAKRTRLELKPTPAARLIERSLELAKAEIKSHKVEIVVEQGDDLPEIMADENRLINVMLNLIINAVQATPAGGAVTVRAEPLGRGLELQIEDSGPGIPDDLKRDIFNPFFTTKADGIGLGLSNALKFVQEHGGELDFNCEGGRTTFFMRLPPSPPTHVEDTSTLRVMPK